MIYSRAGPTLAKSLQPGNGLPRLSPEEALKGERRGARAAGAGAQAGLRGEAAAAVPAFCPRFRGELSSRECWGPQRPCPWDR